MSQFEGQIFVCVKDPALWEKLYDIEIQESWELYGKTLKDVLGDVRGTTWYIDGEWSPEYGYARYNSDGHGIGGLIHTVWERLGAKNCVILGSLTDINTDPFEEIYYCFGGFPQEQEVRGICCEQSISEIADWIKWAEIVLKPEELRYLAGFKEMADVVHRFSPVKRLYGSGADERRGRLLISVKDPVQWKSASEIKLADKKFGLPKDINQRLCATEGHDFILNDAWHVEYGDSDTSYPLKTVVSRLKQGLGSKDCVIVADCADPNVSPAYKMACCVDGSLIYQETLASLDDAKITDVKKWLRLNDIKLTKKKKDYMGAFPSQLFDFTRPTGMKREQDIAKASGTSDRLIGLTFVVTGDVHHFKNRMELKQYVEARGGIMGSDVTPNTSFLITNTPGSGTSKNRKANAYGVPIISEDEFMKRFGD